ncbi:MAG: molybdopterin-synthase adenylyltransferase MoeB [Rubellimicrobium sp.]|nr:molybdopterin-synthase adenylyltransferase MoeB [Rubellimicrobium sp.]
MILREIGGPGQRALKAARVLVVGAGGLGAPALMYLAAAGVGRLGVLDDDVVEVSNLQRQVIHASASLGMKKTASAAATLRALNPGIDIIEHDLRLDAANAGDLFSRYDLILDGTDNFPIRLTINAAAVAAGVPVVGGMLSQWEGQLSVWDPARGGPCLACIFPQAPAAGLAPSCAEAGVLGPLPGIIGTMMAAEAVKIITGAGDPLRGRLLIWDALGAGARVIRLHRDPGCKVCGG